MPKQTKKMLFGRVGGEKWPQLSKPESNRRQKDKSFSRFAAPYEKFMNLFLDDKLLFCFFIVKDLSVALPDVGVLLEVNFQHSLYHNKG